MSSYRSAGSHTRNQKRSSGGRTRSPNRNHRDQIAQPNTFDPIVEWRRIDELTPYARNARTHSPKQVQKIAASIEEFGFTCPVLIDADGGIIAGHGRVEAARRLGMDRVPIIRLDHLSDVQKRAYIIADNRLAVLAGWHGPPGGLTDYF